MQRFVYNKADWDSMEKDLTGYEAPNGSVQECWDHLEKAIVSSMHKHIPLKTASSSKKKPWITSEVKSYINKRNSLYKKWKKKPSPEIHQQ